MTTQDNQNLIKTLEQVFATKKDFDNLEDGLKEWKDEILKSNDKVVKKLDTFLFAF